jgi:hypothetical protein
MKDSPLIITEGGLDQVGWILDVSGYHFDTNSEADLRKIQISPVLGYNIGLANFPTFSLFDMYQGIPVFSHDGKEFSPYIRLSVDFVGSAGIAPINLGTLDYFAGHGIQYFRENDDPVLVNNVTPALPYHGRVNLQDMFIVSDPESPIIRYEVVSALNGKVMIDNRQVKGFSVDELASGVVEFLHTGSALDPEVEVIVRAVAFDRSYSNELSTTFNYTSPDSVVTNRLSLPADQRVTLSTKNFKLVNDNQLESTQFDNYIIRLDIQGADGTQDSIKIWQNNIEVVTAQFKYEDLTSGDIQIKYHYDDKGATQANLDIAYAVYRSQTDFDNSAPFLQGFLPIRTLDKPYSFNAAPTITYLETPSTWDEGKKNPVSLADMGISSIDDDYSEPTGLLLTMTSVSGGKFTLDDKTTRSFTLSEVNEGRVFFVQDGHPGHKPTFTFTLSDSMGRSVKSKKIIAELAETNDDPILKIGSALVLRENKEAVLTTKHLKYSDSEYSPGVDDDSIRFFLDQSVANSFELRVAGTEDVSFSLADLKSNQVTITALSNSAPSIRFYVRDEDYDDILFTGESNHINLVTSFTTVNNAPVIEKASLDDGAEGVVGDNLYKLNLGVYDDEWINDEMLSQLTVSVASSHGVKLFIGTTQAQYFNYHLSDFVSIKTDPETYQGLILKITDGVNTVYTENLFA